MELFFYTLVLILYDIWIPSIDSTQLEELKTVYSLVEAPNIDKKSDCFKKDYIKSYLDYSRYK